MISPDLYWRWTTSFDSRRKSSSGKSVKSSTLLRVSSIAIAISFRRETAPARALPVGPHSIGASEGTSRGLAYASISLDSRLALRIDAAARRRPVVDVFHLTQRDAAFAVEVTQMRQRFRHRRALCAPIELVEMA